MTTGAAPGGSTKNAEFGRHKRFGKLVGILFLIFFAVLAALFAVTWFFKFHGSSLLPVIGGAVFALGFLTTAVRFMQKGARPLLILSEDRLVLTGLWRDRSLAWAEVTKVSTGKGGDGDEIVIAGSDKTLRITPWEVNNDDDIPSLIAFIRAHVPETCRNDTVEFLGVRCEVGQ
jgi:hypothetical protein